MNSSCLVRTGCKINLFLRVLDRRPDGRHNLDSLFLPLASPADRMTVEHSGVKGLEVTCSEPGIDPQANTLTRAYALYAEAGGHAPGLRVLLEKDVPHGAGLGGGSANAAGLLLYLQRNAAACGRPILPEDALAEVAARTGADVPFFLLNRPARAQGIGERLTPVASPAAGMHLVLVCPELRISTAWAFAELDAARDKKIKIPANTLTPDRQEDYTHFALGAKLKNDFEAVVFQHFPELARIRDRLLETGARVALLSGTGSSLFGLFHEKQAAEAAALAVQPVRAHVQAM